jgi:hypothetical protein
MPNQSSELLCRGNALLDATTSFRDYFRVADHPGVIAMTKAEKP